MPIYDYRCVNEECSFMKDNGTRFSVDRVCSMKDRNNLPKCTHCEKDMPRDYNKGCPSVSWKYLSANGVWKTSSLGPCQKADRRLEKYNKGQPIWRPIYKGHTSKK